MSFHGAIRPRRISKPASEFALSLPNITLYLFNPALVRTAYVAGGVSVATREGGARTLVLATITNYVNQTVSWKALGLDGAGVTMVFASGVAATVEGGFTLGLVGSGAFVVTT